MQWLVRHGDILDEPADVLICSANPFLTLSGGVGGALLLRYGGQLQHELECHLHEINRRYMDQESIVLTRPANTPYLAIIHAVAVNGFYESSPEIVHSVLYKAMQAASTESAKSVAVAALATGYGKLSLSDFAKGVRPLKGRKFEPTSQATIVVQEPSEAAEIERVLAEC